MLSFTTLPDNDIAQLLQEIKNIKPSKKAKWHKRVKFGNGQFVRVQWDPTICDGLITYFVCDGTRINCINTMGDVAPEKTRIISLSQNILLEESGIEIEKTLEDIDNDVQFYTGMDELRGVQHTGGGIDPAITLYQCPKNFKMKCIS